MRGNPMRRGGGLGGRHWISVTVTASLKGFNPRLATVMYV